MDIGKSKLPPIDVAGMINSVGINKKIEDETTEANKRLDEIRESMVVLDLISKDLHEAIKAENKMEAALTAATKSSDNVVDGICKAIVDAQQNAVFHVKVHPDHLKQLAKLNQDQIEKIRFMLQDYQKEQEKTLANHEERIKKMLIRNEGIWFSSLWSKVTFCVVGISWIIIAILCAILLN